MKVVNCEVCGAKMSKLPSYMKEKWNGNVCKSCRGKIEMAEFRQYLGTVGPGIGTFQKLRPKEKQRTLENFRLWQKGEDS